MASFTDLPNEIFHQIIPDVLPADLENFAQTCRKAYSVCLPYLVTHRANIRRFAAVGNNAGGFGPFEELLFDVLSQPILGHYVVSLTFRRYDQPGEKQDFESLLPLLPNLKTLAMEDVNISGCELRSQVAPFANAPILTHLANVYIRFRKLSVPSFSIMWALSAMPSMRLLSTQHCGFAGLNPGTFIPFSSHLTRLELWDCYLHSKELYTFLQGTHRLQTFKYSTTSVSKEFDPKWILIGLLCSKSTLRHLTVLISVGPGSSIGSLVDFEVLEEVYIPWGLLEPKSGCRDLSSVLPMPLRLLRLQAVGSRCASDLTELVENLVACKSSHARNLAELVLMVKWCWWCPGETFALLCRAGRQSQRRCIDAGIAMSPQWDCGLAGYRMD